jgi:hypothetical protein
MIFNLPTYKGKYNTEKNIKFLTGDVETDSITLVSLLNLKN